ncbi:MAG: prepilin-type N-terminal cleavage/methylation domain-containing protein [Rubrivivax sp.]|nr:prepilin-type N-terminal cleavage/methylation domain-containing protein [Rubrivivax sp.]
MTDGRRQAGFTLVEVLVALLLMAILSTFTWLALEGVLGAREASRQAIDRSTRLSTVLLQWQQDLQAVHDTELVPALTFDGQTLRITRRVDGGVALVAWSVRNGLWQRWAGPTFVRSLALQQAWLASQQFLGNEAGHLTVADGASEWQVYFHRGSDWSHAQSTGNVLTPAGSTGAGSGAREQLPNAVRVVITLQGQKLTRDIALGPNGQ